MKKIALLGSTGSIGTQTLDVVRQHPQQFEITVLTCGKNIELFRKQLEDFSPVFAVTQREEDAKALKKEFPAVEFSWGKEGLIQAAIHPESDVLLNALTGMMGLEPTYHGICAGKDIALANKETLVAGGQLIMSAVKEAGVKLFPVDSEHSAIFQCLQGNEENRIRKLLLTASGGPFRGCSKEQLAQVTVEQALNHPKWNMGKKITIDSATLMNKGLEVIEAHWLFGVPAEDIQVVVHPQSIIHSMVEFSDHSVVAQLGMPDMRIPIAYALSWPNRLENETSSLDFFELGQLTFEKADVGTFGCLRLAYEALEKGGSDSIVLNAANEVLVEGFLQGKVSFLDIEAKIEHMLATHNTVYDLSLEGILEVDKEVRQRLKKEMKL